MTHRTADRLYSSPSDPNREGDRHYSRACEFRTIPNPTLGQIFLAESHEHSAKLWWALAERHHHRPNHRPVRFL